MVSDSGVTVKGLKVDEANGLCDTAERQSLTPDDNWYLIHHGWWMNFMELKENPEADGLVRMPPINNDSLVTKEADGSYELKPKLVDSLDYVLVPEDVFTALKRAYGVVNEERDVILRKVVENVLADHSLIVEIYPLIVKVANFNDTGHIVPLKISKGESIERICGRAMDLLNIPEVERNGVRFMIDEDGKYTEFLPTKMTQAAVNVLLMEDAVVYLNTGESVNSSGSASGFSSMVTRRATVSTSETNTGYMRRGLCGLQNMGNTCFMNSALQCLSNVPELTEFFLSDTYLREINEQNPLGAQGRLAKAYGCLIKEMWSGSAYSVKPSKLKSVIGEIAPRFNGYSQQDSQELTSFLLDGLHEDLNRIRNKPYTPENEDDDSLSHEQRAQKSWQTYKKRNDSVIVDLFHGQLKSTLVCPVCAKVSVKFDPFCFLSVPVPAKERNTISVITLIRNEKWAKFAINHSTKAIASQATTVIKENLKLPESTRIVLMTTFSSDVLQPEDRLSGPYATTKNFYAFIVDEGPLIVVENKASMQDRMLGVPLVLNMPSNGQSISRRMIYDTIVPLVRERLWKKDSDVEMREDTENISPAKPATDSQLPLPSEAIFYCDKKYINLPNQLNDEVIQLPEDNAGDFKVCLKWKTVDMFQPVELSRLVEREVNMTTTMKKCYSLDECLDMFTSEEQLDQNDSWYCPRCKAHQRAFKKLDLWKLPRILIVHLKRFQYSRYNRDKIETDIVIPTRNFDLAKKLLGPDDKEPKYDLIAISNHMGGLGSGHYTALAINGDTWVEFNDSTASPTRNTRSSIAETMTTREGYILYYRRKDCFSTDFGGSTKKTGLDVKASPTSAKSSPANRKVMNGSFGSPTTRSAARNLNISFNNVGSSNGNSSVNSDGVENGENNGRDMSAKRRLSESTKMDVDE